MRSLRHMRPRGGLYAIIFSEDALPSGPEGLIILSREVMRPMTREEYIEELQGGRPAVVSTLQALCEAEEIGYETARTKLLALSRELGFMPTAAQARDRLLRAFGYIRQTDVGRRTASDVRRWMDERWQRPGVRAIVRVDNGRGGFLLPLLPFPAPEKGPAAVRYEFWADIPFSRLELRLTDVYVHIDGGRVPAGRSGGRRKETIPPEDEDTESFHYANLNPAGRLARDCVVRAIAAAAGLSWGETFDGLAACAAPDVILNRYDVYARYLRSLGFRLHDELRRENRHLTGSQLCSALDGHFSRGETAVTLLGRAHMAAVLPFKTPQGVVRYKIVDTWDSTGEAARDFWVLDHNEK